MKQFSEETARALSTRHLDGARLLVRIDPPRDGPALRFGPKAELYQGEMFEGILLSATPARSRVDPFTLRMHPGGLVVTVANNKPFMRWGRFSDILSDFSLVRADITVLWAAGDGSAGFILFKGKVEAVLSVTEEEVKIAAEETARALEEKLPMGRINTTDYPGADPDHVGEPAPIVYGRAERVRCLSIDAGSISTLIDDIAATDTSIEVTDASAFPGSGTIQIDGEQIPYTGKSGNTFTGCSRGASKMPHDKGAKVAEVQTGYIYLIADHPVSAINNVYVDDVRQPFDPNKMEVYTGKSLAAGYDEDDFLAGYEGKAVVRFKVRPVLKKQAHSEGFTHGGGKGTLAVSRSDGRQTLKVFPDGVAISGAVANPGNAIDYDSTSAATLNPTASLQVCFPDDDFGTVIEQTIHVKCAGAGVNGFNIGCRNDPGGSCLFSFGTPCSTNWAPSPLIVGTSPSWETLYKSGGNWDDAIIFNNSDPGLTGLIYEVWKEVAYIPTSTITGSPSDTLSGNTTAETVIGRVVTADLDGFPDDASGTYTGTPGALIERPDHIRRHMLMELFGLTGDEIDRDSFDEAGSFYAANSYTLAVVLNREWSFTGLAAAIAVQSRTMIFWSQGKERMRWLAPGEEIDGEVRADATRELELGHEDRGRMRNALTALFSRRWDRSGESSYQDCALAADGDSQEAYGRAAETFRWDWIVDPQMASHLLAWWLGFLKEERLVVRARAFWPALKYDPGDVVTFSDNPVLAARASQPGFLIIRVGYAQDTDTVEMEGIEI